MNAGQLEKVIRSDILKYLRTIPRSQWWINHQGPFSEKGVSDLGGLIDGMYVGIEVKRPGEQPTPLQALHGRKVLAAGGTWGVARSVDDARQIIAPLVVV